MTAGYFDLQVNGYAGVDFNSDGLSDERLHHACEKLVADGVDGILATIITDDVEVMCRRISRIAALASNNPVIRGIHIEGPFISPIEGYRGAHPLDAIRPADVDIAKRLLDTGDGLVRLMTLAPECDPDFRTTKMLAKQKVTVYAGHTNASLDQLRGAIDAGLSMFTHLGNGCPMIGMDRHDNVIQRALSLSDKLWLTFIADGVHVPFPALRNYLKAAGVDRSIVVTDAIAPASLGPGSYTLSRWKLVIKEDNVARSPDGSHLIGAVVTMRQSEQNLRDYLGLDERQCEQLLSINPRQAVVSCGP